MKDTKKRLLKDTVYGMIGGVVGTIVMGYAANALYSFESEEKKKQEEALRTEPPYEVLARRISNDVLGVEISDGTKARLGQALHWGYGVGWGGLYGALHDRVPALSKAAGVPFGLAFALVGDEGLNTALKLTPPPRAFPMEAHLRGFAAHVVYAVSADAVFHILRKTVG